MDNETTTVLEAVEERYCESVRERLKEHRVAWLNEAGNLVRKDRADMLIYIEPGTYETQPLLTGVPIHDETPESGDRMELVGVREDGDISFYAFIDGWRRLEDEGGRVVVE